MKMIQSEQRDHHPVYDNDSIYYMVTLIGDLHLNRIKSDYIHDALVKLDALLH